MNARHTSWIAGIASVLAILVAACGSGGGGGGGGGGSSAGDPTTVVAQTIILPGPTCPTGGVHIDWGIDRNGNGALDSGEITGSGDICNGTVATAMSVAVANVRDAGTLQSGFLTGTAANGTSGTVASVQVSLDFGPFKPATGTLTWSYRLPSGALTWRDGSVHTVLAVAKDSNDVISPMTLLTIRKGPNHDVNGDGYADLAVGTRMTNGAVYLFHGTAAGVPSGDYTAAQTALTGVAGTGFGTVVAMGDLNADGYGDVIVGAPSASSSAGAAYVFNGSDDGIASGDQATAATALTGSAGTNFGTAFALGDVNGDGFTDLVAGARGDVSVAGYVYIFQGSSDPIPSGTYSSANAVLTGAVNSYFGGAVAAGDVNGDGYADVLVGSRYTGGSNGAAYLFLGSAGGLATEGYAGADTTFTGVASSWFGGSVAMGDANADGFADIAVGAQAVSTSTGAAYVFHGSATVSPTRTYTGADTTLTGSGSGHAFGASVAVADVNRDGYADVLVGAPGARSIYMFHGTVDGVLSAGAGAADTVLTAASMSSFGSLVAAADVNGDGAADVTAGATDFSTTGAVFVFHGSSAGIPSGTYDTAATALTGPEGSLFGTAVAAADPRGAANRAAASRHDAFTPAHVGRKEIG